MRLRAKTPIFYGASDPFVIRFKVRSIAWLPKEKAIPVREEKFGTRCHLRRNMTRTDRTGLENLEIALI